MEHLTTAHQDTRAQYDFWHDIVERSYAHCDGLSRTPRGFRAEIEIAKCGEAEMTALSSDPVRYTRTERHIRRSQTDSFFVSVMLEGGGRFRQNDRAVLHAPGTVMIYDSARPYEYDYAESYRTMLLRVPRPMMEARMLGVRDLGGTLMTADRPQASLIRGLVGNLMETARDGELPDSFIAPALDLITGAFGHGRPQDRAAVAGRNQALNRIKRFMLEHLGDEELSVAGIATAQNISVRSLGRAFAAEGTTPMAWLRDRRLAEAHARLSEGRGRSVTEVAYDCGFRDLSYFGRAFKKAYGITPRQIASPH
ncbi:helix-turn-helix domain-containing protein [Pseudooceanicola sp. CBS1P-1]|uniref:Helix-turn-helix domain-containing protein n=1 Tax=Pseudooceanicola albus TaxID=2692189 RepID=A0A6L7G2D1_9RHOB|nr:MULTISPECIES: helix-turn-helix domain-containing protein [Pseudooceanicola]MBT9383732.1 helix-turn-helix domain-containing protein [Pseudooceanicola endophyticus]MXN17586.1 helix-turn-helix domain-containing protein [Pseudooceanicola albus]